MNRRRALLGATAGALLAPRRMSAFEYPLVRPRALVFPRDHGAHPDYRIEWWYLTGWLDATPAPVGFQVTFFRTRTDVDPANPSRFAAHQVVIAHAAIAQASLGRLLHDQRSLRAGFGIARASEKDTDVVLDRWTLARHPGGIYSGHVPARGFDLRFNARPTQPLLLQGDSGYSRKGPKPEQASYYYSQPQLAIDAELTLDSRTRTLHGRAWLDHEWSTTLLGPEASGWDWIGMNLEDGGALTAFQIRRQGDGEPLYAYASLRTGANSAATTFAPDAVRFETVSRWESPRTRARYAVAQRIRVGERTFETQPLFADQELDSRATTGAVYWEGASTLLEEGRPVGRGYLEMTGYAAPIRL